MKHNAGKMQSTFEVILKQRDFNCLQARNSRKGRRRNGRKGRKRWRTRGENEEKQEKGRRKENKL